MGQLQPAITLVLRPAAAQQAWPDPDRPLTGDFPRRREWQQMAALGLIVRSPKSTRCCLPDQASPTTMSLLRSLTTAPTSTPRRTTLHPRHTAAKLQEWHTDRALKQFRSIWWQEETSSCRTDRRHT